MSQLAIHGGKPIRTKLFPAHKIIGDEEKHAVNRVLDSGVLSRYLGAWHDDFNGGPEVRAFEEEWAAYFNVKHAIAVNSCSSGLQCAVGALEIEPGDEIIVTPYSMCISATAPLFYGAIPVFADIEKTHFCLDPESIRKKITPQTKAIIIVDLFGLPHDAEAIKAIAKTYNLKVIEDAAQAPGVKYKDQWAGTLSDLGVYSLNYHKHIHTGEGGVVVTNDDDLADRVRLIRNHAEAVVAGKGTQNLANMLGYNFRLTEIQAALGRSLLKKLETIMAGRIENCNYLNEKLKGMPGLMSAPMRPHAGHAYYMQPFLFDENIVGVKREIFVEALKAELPYIELREHEGKRVGAGYVKPLYLLPIFQQQKAFGSKGYPFNLAQNKLSYEKGTCPVVELMHEKKLITHEYMHYQATKNDMDDVVAAFHKVYELKDQLTLEKLTET